MKALLTALMALALLPASAAAQDTGSDALTRQVSGHGTMLANGGAPPCSSPAATPEASTFPCGSISASRFGNCPPPGAGPGNCSITLSTQAPPGWQFVRWTGDRCNNSTAALCGFVVMERICDQPGGECRLRFPGPFTVRAVFQDVRAPTVGNLGGPAENSVVVDDSRRQTFTFNTDEDDEAPTFECRLDGGAATPCTSPRVLTNLADGVHDFCVSAKDASGKASMNTPCRHWEQQTRPTAAIVTHPDVLTRSSAAAFTYASNKTARLTFECSLDGAAFATCPAAGVQLNGLGDGAHRFSVRSVFRGVLDGPAVRRLSEVASFDWVIDTSPPETSITAGPAEGSVIDDAAPAFSFASSEDGSRFACSLDGGPATACTSPFTATLLAGGEHTVAVTATDPIGNTDPTPAVRRFSLAVFIPAPIDRDHDGYAAALDCDDGNPAINPGAPEIPGNKVDEDCDGVAAPYPRVLALITNAGKAYAKETRFSRFLFGEVPAGGTAELRCTAPRKRACPFTRRVVKLVKGAGNALTKSERRHGLKVGVGATIEARVTVPRMIGRVRRFKIAKLAYPKGETLCLAPGAKKPAKCPPL